MKFTKKNSPANSQFIIQHACIRCISEHRQCRPLHVQIRWCQHIWFQTHRHRIQHLPRYAEGVAASHQRIQDFLWNCQTQNTGWNSMGMLLLLLTLCSDWMSKHYGFERSSSIRVRFEIINWKCLEIFCV